MAELLVAAFWIQNCSYKSPQPEHRLVHHFGEIPVKLVSPCLWWRHRLVHQTHKRKESLRLYTQDL